MLAEDTSVLYSVASRSSHGGEQMKPDAHTPSRQEWWPFVVSAAALLLIFVGSGSPTPLFNTYRETTSITDAHLALTTSLYFTTTALSLLLLGRLSDYLGRRAVSIAAVLLAAGGCLVLTQVNGPEVLALGRLLQGLSCGMGSTALGAFVVDTAPPRSSWLAALITGSAPPFAIPIGALFSGAIMRIPDVTPTLTYLIISVLLLTLAVLLYFCPDTVRPKPGALRSMRPYVRIPAGSGRIIFAAGAAFAATWSMGGFFQSFSASLTADHLGSTDTFVIALVFSAGVSLSPVGGALSGRLRVATAVRTGLTVFVLAVMGFITALQVGSIVWFLIAAVVAGLGQGAATTGGMRSVLSSVSAPDRAGVLATMYLICYSSGAIPSLVVGQLADVVPINVIAIGQGVLVVIAAVISMSIVRNYPPRPA